MFRTTAMDVKKIGRTSRHQIHGEGASATMATRRIRLVTAIPMHMSRTMGGQAATFGSK
jgi:hypothetical protein